MAVWRRSVGQSEDGVISIMTAVMAMTLLIATSLAVDVGRVAYVSRDQQGVTDRAVLDAVSLLGPDLPVTALTLADVHSAVELALQQSLLENPGAAGTAEGRDLGLVELGEFNVDTGQFTQMCSADFDLTSQPTCLDGTGAAWSPHSATALRVETESFVPFLFAFDLGGRDVVKTSVAQSMEIGSVTVGSELLGLSPPLLNDMLSSMLCPGASPGDPATCGLGISLVGYQGLIGADIALGDLLGGLGIAAGSPSQVLNTNVTMLDLITASAAALDDQGGVAAVTLNGLVTTIPGSQTINLGELLNVTTATTGQAADARINVFDLISGGAQLSNGTNAIALPDLGVAVPGVAGVDASLAVIEAPQTAVGPANLIQTNPGNVPAVYDWRTKARTSQVDVTVDAQLDLAAGGAVAALSGLLGGLGVLDIVIDDFSLPLSVEAATAESALTDIRCGDPSDPVQATTEADTNTVTNGVRVRVGDGGVVTLANVRIRVLPILGIIPLGTAQLAITAQLDTPLGGTASADHTFTGPYRAGPGHTDGGPSPLAALSAADLNIQIVPSGSGLTGVLAGSLGGIVGALNPVVNSIVTSLIPQIDTLVLGPVLDQLGVEVGNADTWINSVNCNGRVLGPLLD